EIEGIGESLGKKIEQYLETGKIKEYENLKKSVPPGLPALMAVPGLGPKKAKSLQEDLGLKSMEDLKQADRDHRVAGLPGFGKKSEEKIAENIGRRRAHLNRIPLERAKSAAQRVISWL